MIRCTLFFCLWPLVLGATPEAIEESGLIVVEAEHATRPAEAEIAAHSAASGGRGLVWNSAEGRADYTLRVATPGTWHVWFRTQAKDHVSNGLFIELNGRRLSAPSGHAMAPTEVVYLKKHATEFSWTPEWQAPGEGRHAGPITLEFPVAGLHTLTLVARSRERPFIDKIVLSRAAAPAFISGTPQMGPRETWRDALPGQLVVHPLNPARFGRLESDGRVADLMLCGLGSPEGLLFLPPEQQDHILAELIRHGGNMLYAMAVRSHGGDGGPTENPFIGHDPLSGLNEAVLTRWESFFRRAHAAGIYVFLLLYDDDAAPFGGRKEDAVPPAEAAFFTQFVRRFTGVPNLIWCVAEEYHDALTPPRASALAQLITTADPHRRPVAIHQATGDTTFDFHGEPHVEIFAQQPRADSVASLHAEVLAAVRDVAGQRIVHMAENWNNRSNDLAKKGDHAACVAAGDRTGVRQRNWAVAMAGATVQVIGPWERISRNQPATPAMLADMRTLVRFFSVLPLHRLAPRDELAGGDARWALADPAATLIVAHALDGEGILSVAGAATGSYHIEWLDCATGSTAISNASAPDGRFSVPRPSGIGPECVMFARIR